MTGSTSSDRARDRDRALDPVRRLIVERARDARLTLADLSRMADKNESYMHQFVHRGSPKVLPEGVRLTVAQALGVPEGVLRDPSLPVPPVTALAPPGAAGTAALAAADVPVFNDQAEIDLSRISEFAPRPPQLAGVAGVFAIWISSRTCRLRPGDLAYVRPGQPPRPGDLVVVLDSATQRISGLGELTDTDGDSVTVRTGSEPGLQTFAKQSHRVLKVAAVTLA